jgi:hypothetical protein
MDLLGAYYEPHHVAGTGGTRMMKVPVEAIEGDLVLMKAEWKDVVLDFSETNRIRSLWLTIDGVIHKLENAYFDKVAVQAVTGLYVLHVICDSRDRIDTKNFPSANLGMWTDR